MEGEVEDIVLVKYLVGKRIVKMGCCFIVTTIPIKQAKFNIRIMLAYV